MNMPCPLPRNVVEIFNDFQGRRAGIVRALTDDVEEFYRLCDPAEENLCLFGHPNETWELNQPVKLVPPELPEPSLGINFARDGMLKKQWLSLVAAHSDSWLMSVAFYICSRFRFDKSDRMWLFQMINDYRTVHEEVESRPVNQPSQQAEPVPNESESEEYYEEELDVGILCGACCEDDEDESWVRCYICDEWYHGSCVGITLAQAEHINQKLSKFKCPGCRNNKRPRS